MNANTTRVGGGSATATDNNNNNGSTDPEGNNNTTTQGTGFKAQTFQSSETLFGLGNKFMAIARVFCGQINVNNFAQQQQQTIMNPEDLTNNSNNNNTVEPKLIAYSTNYSPTQSYQEQIKHTTILPDPQSPPPNNPFKVFSLMGRDCQPLQNVVAGNIVGNSQ
eukprot:UN10683